MVKTGGSSKPKYCTFQQRKEQLRRACGQHKAAKDRLANIYVDEKYKLAVCMMAKVGTSTLKRFLTSLHGISPHKPPRKAMLSKIGIKKLQDLTPTQRTTVLGSYHKVIVVRHPLSRLKSSYHNKFVYTHFVGGGKYSKAIAQHRKNKADHSKDMRFDEFMKYSHSHNNEHWRTYDESCQTCDVHYDYVIKLETFNHDLETFGRGVLNIPLEKIFHGKLNTGHYSGAKAQIANTSTVIEEHKQLTDKEWKVLFESRYGHDMRTFGYGFDRKTSVASCGTDCC